MRRISRIAVVFAAAALVLVPTAAQADPSFYESPIFGITTAGSSLLVADAGQGIVNGDTGALVAALPGVDDVAARSGGRLWALTGAGDDPEQDTGQALWSISAGGVATQVVNLFTYEQFFNPHPDSVDSNPFDVADAGGGKALVADAGGNDLLLVGDGNSPNSDTAGRVKLVATFPNELVSTANAKSIVGCPSGPPDICGLPPMIPAQPVPTSIAVGPDGAYYVGELKGFPAPTGESRVWRIEPGSRNVSCGESKKCKVVLDGFTSIIDLAFGPDGRLNVAQIDDDSWFAMENDAGVGGSVHACNLQTNACSTLVSGKPILTAIAYRGTALWGATWSLVPGLADVTPLTP